MAYKPKTLAVSEGGTSLTTLTAHALYVGNGTSAPTALGVGTTGQVLQGNTEADPSWGTAATSFTWSEQTGSPVSAAVNNGYVANLGTLLTFDLPGTFAVGDVIAIVGKGAGLWVIDAPAGDTIHFGSSDSSSGGTVTATNRYDCIEIIGTVANSEWTVRSSIGNLTVA
jgi:hypothetical protein